MCSRARTLYTLIAGSTVHAVYTGRHPLGSVHACTVHHAESVRRTEINIVIIIIWFSARALRPPQSPAVAPKGIARARLSIVD